MKFLRWLSKRTVGCSEVLKRVSSRVELKRKELTDHEARDGTPPNIDEFLLCPTGV